jgi:hypothetical protein
MQMWGNEDLIIIKPRALGTRGMVGMTERGVNFPSDLDPVNFPRGYFLARLMLSLESLQFFVDTMQLSL